VSTVATSTLQAAEAVARPRRQGLVLACMCTCTILVMGLVAAINLAVPDLAGSGLHPSGSQLLWIVDAYVVVFACLVIPGGAAGDRFGRKGALICGLAVFAAGAAISAAAPDVVILLVGRSVTGLGAALVLPNCVGVLVHATEPEHRRKALAVWGAVSGMGGIVGNLVGGALLTAGSWRLLFAVVAPVALVCALWAALATSRSARSDRNLDPLGTLLFVAATVALLTGIIEGPEHGWGSSFVIGAFAVGAVLAVVWVLAELRAEHPILDPRLFRIPALSGASLGMLVTFFGCFGLFYLNASILQYARGYSVLLTGLGILPLAVPLLVASRVVPKLVARFGIPPILGAAFVAISVGLFGLAAAAHQSYLAYAAWLVVIGLGFALALPALSTELTASLPAHQAGIGGGLQSATRELGSALGVAVVGTVLSAVFVRHLPISLLERHPVPQTVAEALKAAPAQHAAIVEAFTTGAVSALRVAAVVTLVAGALVVAGAYRAARRPAQ
jgi:MFS family permease